MDGVDGAGCENKLARAPYTIDSYFTVSCFSTRFASTADEECQGLRKREGQVFCG